MGFNRGLDGIKGFLVGGLERGFYLSMHWE